MSSIVSSAVRFCVALLSVWFACFGFIYRYHRVSQSTNWYFAKRDGYKRKHESSATWSVKCGFDRTFLLLSFVRCFASQSTISFRFAKYRKPSKPQAASRYSRGPYGARRLVSAFPVGVQNFHRLSIYYSFCRSKLIYIYYIAAIVRAI